MPLMPLMPMPMPLMPMPLMPMPVSPLIFCLFSSAKLAAVEMSHAALSRKNSASG
jgi:hypothetical protein